MTTMCESAIGMSNSAENNNIGLEKYIYVKGIFNLKTKLKQTNLEDC